MKNLVYFIGLLLLLTACAPKASNIQTAGAETEIVSPTDTVGPMTDTPQLTITLTPTVTKTPMPTFTPSPTITLPEVVKDILVNPKVFFWEDFDHLGIRSSPSGWTGNPTMPFVTNEHELGLIGQTVGFYYGDTITPNEAVVTRFKFGANPSFTIGIYIAKGRELIPNKQPGSRSLSLVSRFTPMITNYVDGQGTTYYFDRQVELEIDHWYMFMLGFTKDQTYFIKVWDPENPELVLSFEQKLADMPSSYTFVYWAAEGSEISIDDFTILRFSYQMPTATPTLEPTATLTPEPSPKATQGVVETPVSEVDDMVFTYIPAGTFQMGAPDNTGYTVTLDAFWMDTSEVTNAMYEKCVADGNCTPPDSSESSSRSSYYGNSEYANYPVIWMSWDQATAYCAWAGRRLPTEAEWEYAARGGLEGKIYPWGDEFPMCDLGAEKGAQFSSCSPDDTIEVGSFAPNGYGLYDMAGNVLEWVSDWYGQYPSGSVTNPAGPDSSNGTGRVVRGGSWIEPELFLRVANRMYLNPSRSFNVNGFRCARSP
jgi:formylglycine-generating enzyme required for sulfatase activity